IAATGEGDTLTPGVGLLRSMDGGKSWQVLDSAINADAAGTVFPIGDARRNHLFVGTTAYKIVADVPDRVEFPRAATILYAAMGNTPGNIAGLPTSNNGGIYRSLDLGNSWQLLRPGNATDVLLGLGNAVTTSSGNVEILYGAFQGQGVYIATDAPVQT